MNLILSVYRRHDSVARLSPNTRSGTTAAFDSATRSGYNDGVVSTSKLTLGNANRAGRLVNRQVRLNAKKRARVGIAVV